MTQPGTIQPGLLPLLERVDNLTESVKCLIEEIGKVQKQRKRDRWILGLVSVVLIVTASIAGLTFTIAKRVNSNERRALVACEAQKGSIVAVRGIFIDLVRQAELSTPIGETPDQRAQRLTGIQTFRDSINERLAIPHCPPI